MYFLGDLFDGGREWGTGIHDAPDKRWKRYGKKFWLKEYNRFGRIFLDRWKLGPTHLRSDGEPRRFIADLPGNHDLGLGSGIRSDVRQRFHAFFGTGNRIDIIANHTFVSVDTVSLSAKGELKDNSIQSSEQEIWGPADEFLSNAKTGKQQALDRYLRYKTSKGESDLLAHQVAEVDTDEARVPRPEFKSIISSGNGEGDLPTVLLTHVPLYRAPGTPCGPLRERYPPSRIVDGTNKPVESDEPNAIKVQAGYQYQNVLVPSITQDLISKIGNIQWVFSGDDHDYCEVIHRDYTPPETPGILEITVKSMSWAMGIRRPGFQMLSLWNPIDDNGVPLPASPGSHGAADVASTARSTAQTHLCLLPNQLSIFIRYALLLGITLLILITHSTIIVLRHPNSKASSPTTTKSSSTRTNLHKSRHSSCSPPPYLDHQTASSSSSNSSDQGHKGPGTGTGKSLALRTSTRTINSTTLSPDDDAIAMEEMDGLVNTPGRLRTQKKDVARARPRTNTMPWREGDEDVAADWDGSGSRSWNPRSRTKSWRRRLNAFTLRLRGDIIFVGGMGISWFMWLVWTS